jgi:hypothetical protein
MADLGKRYSRNLMGINASGAVSVTHAAAIPATEGHTAFEATDTSGTVTYVTGTALVATSSHRLIQLQNGEIRASQAFLGSDVLAITNTDYVAPVIQVSLVAVDDTIAEATLDVAGLKEFVIAARDTTPGNQPFPVMEARVAIRDITTTKIQMLTALANAFNDVVDYEGNADENFATALTKGTVTASGTVFPVGVAPSGTNGGAVGDNWFTLAAATGVAAIGDRVAIGGYLYTLARAHTAADSIVYLTSPLAIAASAAVYPHGSVTLTATGIGIVANDQGIHFTAIATEDLEAAVTITAAIAWKQGTGDPESVAAMEEEFYVFAGETTINEAWREDFGKATRFTQASETYGISFIKYKKGTASMAFANEQAHHVGYIILANDGGSAIVVAPV